MLTFAVFLGASRLKHSIFGRNESAVTSPAQQAISISERYLDRSVVTFPDPRTLLYLLDRTVAWPPAGLEPVLRLYLLCEHLRIVDMMTLSTYHTGSRVFDICLSEIWGHKSPSATGTRFGKDFFRDVAGKNQYGVNYS